MIKFKPLSFVVSLLAAFSGAAIMVSVLSAGQGVLAVGMELPPTSTPTPAPTPTPPPTSTPSPTTQPTPTPATTIATAAPSTPSPSTSKNPVKATTSNATPAPSSSSSPAASAEGPSITGLTIDTITPSSARITWQTTVASDSVVECLLDGDYAEQNKTSELVTAHEAVIKNLHPSTDYTCRVKSSDNLGAVATSPDQTFTTLSNPQVQRAETSAQPMNWWLIIMVLLLILLLLLWWLSKKRKDKKLKEA